MYRQYENPYNLEEQLKELQEEYKKAIEANANEETIMYLAFDIEELKERINFAWQDDAEE
jgi:vacuolar-type H+-ATPase subunit D/Vma8